MEKKFLFACGVPRSGTTALCRALNLHEKIVVGVERYKFLMMRGEFPEDPQRLFEKDRFFDYRAEDTNIGLDFKDFGLVYDAAREKFDDAVYVGDKTPGLFKRLPKLKAGLPGCKAILILRSPENVAFSWQNRADQGRGLWPAANGYEASVTEWNRCLSIIETQMSAWGEDLILLNYESIFGANAKTLFAQLLDQLGLGTDLNPALEAFLEEAVSRAGNERDIPQHIRDYVAEHADFKRYERIQAMN